MALTTLTTGEAGQGLHGRTTATEGVASQAFVLGTDGSNAVLDPATLATQATLAAILAKIIAAPATEATLAAVLAAVDGLEAGQAGQATQTTLAALLADSQAKADLSETQPVSAASLPLPTGAATAAKQDTLLAAVDGLELLCTGPDTVYRGTSTATIDLAAGERLHSVLVFPTASGQVTVTAPGQPADQCPVDVPYAEDFKGGLGGPTDLVIGGAVAYYRVTTYTP